MWKILKPFVKSPRGRLGRRLRRVQAAHQPVALDLKRAQQAAQRHPSRVAVSVEHSEMPEDPPEAMSMSLERTGPRVRTAVTGEQARELRRQINGRTIPERRVKMSRINHEMTALRSALRDATLDPERRVEIEFQIRKFQKEIDRLPISERLTR